MLVYPVFIFSVSVLTRFLSWAISSPSNVILCPVLNSLDTAADGLVGYPMELFSPGSLNNSNDLVAYNCTSPQLLIPRYFRCSTDATCPITANDLKVAKSFQRDWNVSHSMCALRRALNSPGEIVRVIVFGGSVTAGQKSEGCYCDTNLNANCARWKQFKNTRCPWSFYFSHWLRRAFKADISYFNLARLGWSTGMLNNNFEYLLRHFGLDSFTENDIIFLDESVNDGSCEAYEVKIQMASLARRIYRHSINYSWPTVVVSVQGKRHVEDMYSNVAREFHWPLWSIRDTTRGKNDSYTRFLQFEGSKDLHPPWFVHLYAADVYAGLFQSEMETCQQMHGITPESTPRSFMTPLRIPSGSKSELDMCDDTNPLVDVHAMNASTFRDVVINATGNWKYMEDRPTKFGWIAQFPNNGPNISSWISFSLRRPPNFVNEMWMLKVYFMRTYLNAGEASFTVCGRGPYNNKLQSYWTKHESTPAMQYAFVQGAWAVPTSKHGCPDSEIVVNFTHFPMVPAQIKPDHGFQKVKLVGFEMCRVDPNFG